MLTPLTDQVGHAVSDTRLRPSRSSLRFPVIQQLVTYSIPGPKDRIRGPAYPYFGGMTKAPGAQLSYRTLQHHPRQINV
jgi:hypothetical protein